jgi:hypothetical protein
MRPGENAVDVLADAAGSVADADSDPAPAPGGKE